MVMNSVHSIIVQMLIEHGRIILNTEGLFRILVTNRKVFCVLITVNQEYCKGKATCRRHRVMLKLFWGEPDKGP
jgi:hypothetical protein